MTDAKRERRVIADRFALIEPIGRGGYGDVFRAIQLSVDREVAVKLVHSHLTDRDDVAARFTREARLTSRLAHPNAVRVIDFGSDSGTLFLAMELIDGPTLKSELNRRGALPVEEALPILRDIARGLSAAHAIGLVHRDLKPANVILADNPDGGVRPVVIDFGLVKMLHDEESTLVTESNVMIGTPAYMSPEVVVGDPVDDRTDVFSLGVVAYELLTGRRPFGGVTPLEAATRRLHQPPPSLPSTFDVGVADLVNRLLARSPRERPSALAVVGEIDSLLAPAPGAVDSTRLLDRSLGDLTVAPTRGPGAKVGLSPAASGPENARARATDRSSHGPGGVGRLTVAAVASFLVLAIGAGAWVCGGGGRQASTATAEVEGPVALVAPGSAVSSAEPAATGEEPQVSSTTSEPSTLVPLRWLSATESPPTIAAPEGQPEVTEDEPSSQPNLRVEGVHEPANAGDGVVEGSSARDSTPQPRRREPRSASESQTATIHVNADPWGEVFIDGRAVGHAPARATVPAPGRYSVSTRYLEQERSEAVDVRPGDVATVTHRFRR